MMTTEIFTIGHSNHTWDSFAPLLADNGVELLVDTRTRPVSRFAPFANHRTLPDLLEGAGIDYEFMGGPLGGKPQNPAMYDSAGKPDYHKMRALDDFQEAISQLAGMASRRATAILCSEEDPSQCHRLLLIGPALEEEGCQLLHIRADGPTANHRPIVRRQEIRQTTPKFIRLLRNRNGQDIHHRIHRQDRPRVL